MADISLKEYQTKLDNLLTANQYSEVIAHSRHILQAHPKNLTAYRQLALALFGLSRWDESGELFRRLLGSVPNDFVSHHRLSQIYENAKNYEDAIWHLERAFDQQPNNQDIIKKLRDLYRIHRNVDVTRIQLTAGAVAQQHVRNNLYDQAIEVLHKALDRYPSRVDLRLLLARSLWFAERYLDAAETAIDVLAVLPYSMIANRILTELWLMEKRPSDAQRYLSRIEDLDPYLAYRLATGENPPDDLLLIEELDYATVSRHELATANPDWLTAIDETSEQAVLDEDDDAWLDDFIDEDEALETGAPQKKVTDDLENLLPDEWQQRVDALETAPDDDDLDALFADEFDLDEDFDGEFDLSEFEDELDASSSQADNTEEELPEELLRRIEKMKGLAADETIASINKPVDEDFGVGLTGLLSTLDDQEDMSWLRDVQHGGFDAVVDDVLSSEDINEDDEDLDPDSWMTEFEDVESAPDEERISIGFTGMFDDMADDDEDFDDILDDIDAPELTNALPATDNIDPLAWMSGSGVELSEEELNDEEYDPYGVADGIGFQSAEVDPMDWLKKSNTDSLKEETLFQSQSADPNDIDPLAWMEDGDLEADEEEDFGASDMPQFFDDVEEVAEDEAEDDWLTDDSLLDEMLSMEDDFSTLNFEDDQADDSSDMATVSTQPNDWQDAMNDELNDDWQDEQPDEENDFSWLSEDDDSNLPQFFDDADEAQPVMPKPISDDSVDLEDLFAELSDNDFGDSDEGLEWLETQDMIDDSDSDSEDADVDPLAWMADSGVELSEDAESESTGMTDMLNALEADEASDEDEIDFSFDEAEDEAPTIAQRTGLLDRMSGITNQEEEFPDWLDDPDSAIDESEDEWLAESEADAQADNEAEWLSEIESDGEEDQFHFEDEEEEASFSFDNSAKVDDEPDWLSEMDSEEEAEEVEQPDWLSGVQVDEEDDEFALMQEDASEDEGADWLSDMGDFEDEEESEDQPDWLAGAAVAGAGVAAGALLFGDDDEDEIGDFEDEEDGFATQANQVDWLASVDVDQEDDEEFVEEEDGFVTQATQADWLASVDVDQEEAEDEGANWLSDMGDFEDEEALAEADQPDWLSASDELEEASEDEGVDWLSDAGEFEDEEEDQPDWLAGAAVAGAGVAAGAMFADDDEDDQADWLASADEFEDEEEEEAMPSPTDWLSEEDIDEFGEEALASASSADLDWMQSDDFVDDEVLEDEEMVEYLDAVDPATAESALDWMSDVEDEIIFDEDAEVPEPASITDWLSSDEEEQATTVDEIADDEGEFAEFGDFDEYEDEGTVLGETVNEGADWLSDTGDFEDDDEEEAAPDEMPDWLAGVSVAGAGAATIGAMFGNDDDEDSIEDGESFDWNEELSGSSAQETGEPEWFNAINDSENEDEAFDDEVEEEMWLEDEESFSAETQASSGLYEDEFDYAEGFEEETELTPASDAPDWLNAMVPGLDIDFEAEEDEPVDQGFIEEPIHAADKKDKGFDWLTDIVTEETGPMQAIAPERPQPILAPRFTFSRPPAWLDKLLGTVASTSAVADISADDDFDFEDFDESSDNGNEFAENTLDFDDSDFDDDFADDSMNNDNGDFDDEFPEWLDFDDDDK